MPIPPPGDPAPQHPITKNIKCSTTDERRSHFCPGSTTARRARGKKRRKEEGRWKIGGGGDPKVPQFLLPALCADSGTGCTDCIRSHSLCATAVPEAPRPLRVPSQCGPQASRIRTVTRRQMALLGGLTLLLVMRAGAVPSRAEFTLNFQHDVTGTWRRPAVLPCSYAPHNFFLHSVVWMHDGKRIFERDSTGDHTFMTKYRRRLHLPQDWTEGNVSLTIMDLQTDDKGTYTCQVSLLPDGASSQITKEADIDLAVEKVSVKKPVIQPAVSFLAVPERATVNLTCSAAGSLPITYKWYKYVSGSSGKVFQWNGASFTIDKANPSHSGIYICEAENRIPETKVQQSEELRLSVTDTVTRPAQKTTRTPRVISGSAGPPGKEATLQTAGHSSTAAVATAIITADLHHSPGAPTWLIILVILLSLALICTLIVVLVTRSKNRKGTEGGTYEIPIMSQLDARANQDHPAARICHVSTCQANGPQAGASWTNDITVPRMENRYEPTMAREEEPQSDYQNALQYRENEYEQLLAEKESVQQT